VVGVLIRDDPGHQTIGWQCAVQAKDGGGLGEDALARAPLAGPLDARALEDHKVARDVLEALGNIGADDGEVLAAAGAGGGARGARRHLHPRQVRRQPAAAMLGPPTRLDGGRVLSFRRGLCFAKCLLWVGRLAKQRHLPIGHTLRAAAKALALERGELLLDVRERRLGNLRTVLEVPSCRLRCDRLLVGGDDHRLEGGDVVRKLGGNHEFP
jgi:hypothetical protein